MIKKANKRIKALMGFGCMALVLYWIATLSGALIYLHPYKNEKNNNHAARLLIELKTEQKVALEPAVLESLQSAIAQLSHDTDLSPKLNAIAINLVVNTATQQAENIHQGNPQGGQPFKPLSYSNGEATCAVYLNYDPYNLVLLPSITQDLILTLYHEIGHCYLGKQLPIKNLLWHNEISATMTQERLQQLDKVLNQNIILAESSFNCSKLPCMASNAFMTPHPWVVYHEMFADVFAAFLFQKYHCLNSQEFIADLSLTRFNNYQNNPNASTYQSFRALEHLNKERKCSQQIAFDEINFYTQKGFENYLDQLTR